MAGAVGGAAEGAAYIVRGRTVEPGFARKLKQVLHLTQLLKPALEDLLAEGAQPLVADLGAGKSYLGLILYDLVLAKAGRGELVGIEARAELAATAGAIGDVELRAGSLRGGGADPVRRRMRRWAGGGSRW